MDTFVSRATCLKYCKQSKTWHMSVPYRKWWHLELRSTLFYNDTLYSPKWKLFWLSHGVNCCKVSYATNSHGLCRWASALLRIGLLSLLFSLLRASVSDSGQKLSKKCKNACPNCCVVCASSFALSLIALTYLWLALCCSLLRILWRH